MPVVADPGINTEILEWLSPRLEKLGGDLLQAEDELASINMIIGASFGGVPSLTATSGPGISLMMEGIRLNKNIGHIANELLIQEQRLSKQMQSWREQLEKSETEQQNEDFDPPNIPE